MSVVFFTDKSCVRLRNRKWKRRPERTKTLVGSGRKFSSRIAGEPLMKKAYRVKKNDEFQEVFKKGRSYANRQFVVYFLKKPGTNTFPHRNIRQQKAR